MFVNKRFTYITCAYLKSKRCFNVKSSTYYFHMKTSYRSNHPRMFYKKCVMKNFAKYTGKHLYQSLFQKSCRDTTCNTSVFLQFCKICQKGLFCRIPVGDCFCCYEAKSEPDMTLHDFPSFLQ